MPAILQGGSCTCDDSMIQVNPTLWHRHLDTSLSVCRSREEGKAFPCSCPDITHFTQSHFPGKNVMFSDWLKTFTLSTFICTQQEIKNKSFRKISRPQRKKRVACAENLKMTSREANLKFPWKSPTDVDLYFILLK